jgi:hypothetical protein
MPTPYSFEGRLLAGLNARRMPVDQFAIVATKDGIRGVSKTKLNEFFRDAAKMPNDIGEQCWHLWQEIEKMCRAVEPLAVDLRDGQQVYEWLQKSRRGELIFSQQDALLAGIVNALAQQQQ